MIGLGVWQLQRATWKSNLIARHHNSLLLPTLDGLPDAFLTRAMLDRDAAARSHFEALSFRRVRLACTLLMFDGKLHQIGGRNRADEPGFRNIADCSTEPFAGRLLVDLGWTPPGKSILSPDQAKATFIGQLNPAEELTDRLNPDPDSNPIPFMLVVENAWSGLLPSAPADPNQIPNNHVMYAFQWFAFSVAAIAIYAFALKKRFREASA